MRFIRVKGRVVPIKDEGVKHSPKERWKNAAEGAVSGAAGAGTVYSLAKTAQNNAHKSQRLSKFAASATKNAQKSAGKLQKLIATGRGSDALRDRIAGRIMRTTGRAQSLNNQATKLNFKAVGLKRGAFVLGGLGLGHAISKKIEAITGKEADERSTLTAHAVGLSTAAIASNVIKSAKSTRSLSYAHKVLVMSRRVKL